MLVSVVLMAGCSHPPPNVLFVVVDTLRTDVIGAYGSKRGLTPFLDELADRACVFHSAYAPGSWTKPSVASLLTSRYPSQHGVTTIQARLPERERTLAEVLEQRGFRNAGFVANPFLPEAFGFAQGYATYRILSRGKMLAADAKTVNREAAAWAATVTGPDRPPSMLHLHYMEPHPPYAPSDEALAAVTGKNADAQVDQINRRINELILEGKPAGTDDIDLAAARGVYEASVMTLDRELRNLFEELERVGFLRQAITVVTADHGEEIGDHGFFGHGRTLYGEVLNVPLIVVLPDQDQRIDVEEAVSLVDVAPTVLDAVGIPPEEEFEGRSLLPLVRSRDSGFSALRRALFGPETVRSAPVFAEHGAGAIIERDSLRAVIHGRYKLIQEEGRDDEFYDLVDDPHESSPGSLDQQTRSDLRRSLAGLQKLGNGPLPRETLELDENTSQRIRALGYGP